MKAGDTMSYKHFSIYEREKIAMALNCHISAFAGVIFGDGVFVNNGIFFPVAF